MYTTELPRHGSGSKPDALGPKTHVDVVLRLDSSNMHERTSRVSSGMSVLSAEDTRTSVHDRKANISHALVRF